MLQVGPATRHRGARLSTCGDVGWIPGLCTPLTTCSPVTCRALKATPASRGMREKLGTLERM